MGISVIGGSSGGAAPSTPAPGFIPSPAVPAGLTLRQTITASGTPTKTGWPEWVYVVAVGGGGSGGDGESAGGGGGACIQGWMQAQAIGAIAIGAGGAPPGSGAGNVGSQTTVGPVRAGGGGGGSLTPATPRAYVIEPGAGMGGSAQGTTAYSLQHMAIYGSQNIAYGLFVGGRNAMTPAAPSATATSGAGGGSTNGSGGSGHQGPGGGGGQGNSAAGGNSLSPTGTFYSGGAGANAVGGGGAGILAAGEAAIFENTGGAGGLGGGGGGGCSGSSFAAGAGGNGAVLIYY